MNSTEASGVPKDVVCCWRAGKRLLETIEVRDTAQVPVVGIWGEPGRCGCGGIGFSLTAWLESIEKICALITC